MLNLRTSSILLAGKSRQESDEGEDEDDFSDSEDKEQKTSTPKKVGTAKQTKLDFLNLPVLNTNGLRYLPHMQYFAVDADCPLKTINTVDKEALTVIIHLPKGGFNCVAIPLEGVEKDKSDEYEKFSVRKELEMKMDKCSIYSLWVFVPCTVTDESSKKRSSWYPRFLKKPRLASASKLSLEGFQKLIKSAGSKKRDPENSGKTEHN
jgi:hypothetical protein